MTSKRTPKLIVALDVPRMEEALSLRDRLADLVDYYKVGSELFTAILPAARA